MSSGRAHPVDHCMCAHRVDHWMCAPSGPLDVCICITTTCKHPRVHHKRYIRWSTRCSYIWWTTSSPLVVIRMQRHLVDHRMYKSPVYRLWNSLPIKICSCTSLVSFKSMLKTHRMKYCLWSRSCVMLFIVLNWFSCCIIVSCCLFLLSSCTMSAFGRIYVFCECTLLLLSLL